MKPSPVPLKANSELLIVMLPAGLSARQQSIPVVVEIAVVDRQVAGLIANACAIAVSHLWHPKRRYCPA